MHVKYQLHAPSLFIHHVYIHQSFKVVLQIVSYYCYFSALHWPYLVHLLLASGFFSIILSSKEYAMWCIYIFRLLSYQCLHWLAQSVTSYYCYSSLHSFVFRFFSVRKWCNLFIGFCRLGIMYRRIVVKNLDNLYMRLLAIGDQFYDNFLSWG